MDSTDKILLVIIALVTLLLVIGAVRRSYTLLLSRRRGRMDREEILQKRWQFMRKLYALTNGNPGRRIRQRKLRRELDWTVADLEPVQDYLHDAGLIDVEVTSTSDAFEKFIQWVFPGDAKIKITSIGVDEVEQGQRNPHQSTPHLPPYITIYGDHAQVQVGTSHSSQVQIRKLQFDSRESGPAGVSGRIPSVAATTRSLQSGTCTCTIADSGSAACLITA
jgi:hypothetical protein